MDDLFLKKFTRRDFLANTAKLCYLLGLSSIFPGCVKTEPSSNETKTEVAPGKTGADFEPAYLKLYRTGELKRRAEKLWAIMENCQLCPRRCRVNRLQGMSGFCRTPGAALVISAFHPHFGEERPLVGNGGSGTIFLTHCNLRCVFCQNWTISHLGRGAEAEIDEFAEMMLQLQEIGRAHV